jgi:hypothetical protein
MEAVILAAEDEVARLEALISDPDIYTKHGCDSPAFEAQLKTARDTVAGLYTRWEELEAIRTAGT